MQFTTEILIIRHGQTAWNKARLLQGHSDIPLNEKGEMQALALAEAMREEKLDAIWASDSQRAYRTAEAIARHHNLPVFTDADFRERCYGLFEGMHADDIQANYPESHAAWHADEPDHVFPPGERIAESRRQFHHRSTAALLRLAEQYQGKRVALVTHFGVIESAYRESAEIPLGTPCRMPVLNTSINHFNIRHGKITLVKWGDAEHLEPMRKPVEYLKHF